MGQPTIEPAADPLPAAVLVDPVEAGLAEALALAARAAQWGVVEVLARQLDQHRLARTAANVADLDAERRKREKR